MNAAELDSQLIFWLQQLKGISRQHIQALYKRYDPFATLLESTQAEISACIGVSAANIVADRRCDFVMTAAQIEAQFGEWQQMGIAVLPITSPQYPTLLRTIHSPPHLLYIRGDITLLSLPQLAIVGSRHHTGSGGQIAKAFARRLTQQGFTITSGLALGIDGMAHQGALQEGVTIAVLGAGVESIYPRRHQYLAEQIMAAKGCLVSEFTPGTPPRAANFPQRNRIISGLSLGVLVVEAALKSGSLITARTAMEQGREVFAVPGSIHNPVARGCHQLIRDGATLVENIADIIEPLQGMVAFKQEELCSEQASHSAIKLKYAVLLNKLDFDPVDFDQLLARCKLSVPELLRQLSELELQGLIERRGGCYARINLC